MTKFISALFEEVAYYEDGKQKIKCDAGQRAFAMKFSALYALIEKLGIAREYNAWKIAKENEGTK
jgi:hypothetical protein